MARFRWGRVAMQLALCLLTGLRMVSASIQGSTCAILQRLSMLSPQVMHHEQQPRIAPPTQRWSVDMFDISQSGSTGEAMKGLEQGGGGEGVVAGVKRSLMDKLDCASIEKRSHNRHGRNDTDCSVQPAGEDYTGDRATEPSNPKLETASIGTGSPPTWLDSPGAGSNGSSVGASSASNNPDITSNGNGSSDDSSNAPPRLTSLSGLIPSSPPEPSQSSLDSSSLDGPSSSSVPSSLPSINYGNVNANDSGSKHNGSDSASNPELDTGLSSGSTNKARSIAIGVTVPVGIVALGVVALFVLRNQRKRRRRMQMGSTVEGMADVEAADVAVTRLASPNAVDTVADGVSRGSDGRQPEAQIGDIDQGEQQAASEEGSNPNLGTARAEPQVSVPHGASPNSSSPPPPPPPLEPPAVIPAVSERRLSRTPSRLRSQKRKPVPALLDAPETGVSQEALAAP